MRVRVGGESGVDVLDVHAGFLGVGVSDWLRASPDFPDEARPLIGPRFGSGFGCGVVEPCGVGGRSKVEPSQAQREGTTFAARRPVG